MTEEGDSNQVPVPVPQTAQEQAIDVAVVPVLPAVRAPVEEAVSASERAPLESSTQGLLAPKGPIRASSGLFSPFGVPPVSDTSAPAAPGPFSGPSTADPVFGAKSTLSTGFAYGMPPKASSFGTQARGFLGVSAAVDPPSSTHVAMEQGDREVINAEGSAVYMGSERGDREGEEREGGDGHSYECEDIEGAGLYMEEESTQPPFQKAVKDLPLPLPLPGIFSSSSAPSSFSILKSAASSPFGFISPTPAEGAKPLSSFGSVALSTGTGSSFGAAAPFFLKPAGTLNLWGQPAGSPRAPGAAATAFGASNTITLPASASTSASSGAILSASASPFIPAVIQEVAEEGESLEDLTPAPLEDDTPTPILPDPIPFDAPAASETAAPQPTGAGASVPVRAAAGRKPKPKPAHLTAAIPAYAHVRTGAICIIHLQWGSKLYDLLLRCFCVDKRTLLVTVLLLPSSTRVRECVLNRAGNITGCSALYQYLVVSAAT